MVKIGEGGYGCAYDPSLLCKEKKPTEFYKNKISKALTKKHALDEIKEQKLFDNVDTNYEFHLKQPTMCDLDIANNSNVQFIKECDLVRKKKIKLDSISLLIMDNGGMDLVKFAKYITKSNEKTIFQKKNIIKNFWRNSIHLIRALHQLNINEIMHHDLKPHNVVFDIETSRFNIIDFGLSKPMNQFNTLKICHFSYPPETKHLIKTMYDQIRQFSNERFANYLHLHSSTNFEFKQVYLTFLNFVSKRDFKSEVSEHAELGNYKEFFDFKDYQYFLNLFTNNFYKNKDYNSTLQKCVHTFDTYGMGMALIHVLINTFNYITDNDVFINEIYKLLFSMIHPDPFNRPTTNELLEKYTEVLDLLKDKTQIILQNDTISPEIIKNNTFTLERNDKMNKNVKNALKCDDSLGLEFNPETGRCRKKCNINQERDPQTKRCRNKTKQVKMTSKTRKIISKKHIKKNEKKCKDDEEINPETGRCRKKCKENEIRNPATKRCNKIR